MGRRAVSPWLYIPPQGHTGKFHWPLPEGGEIAGGGQQRVANTWLPLPASQGWGEHGEAVELRTDPQCTSGQILFKNITGNEAF